jgi:hypothetical protein
MGEDSASTEAEPTTPSSAVTTIVYWLAAAHVESAGRVPVR